MPLAKIASVHLCANSLYGTTKCRNGIGPCQLCLPHCTLAVVPRGTIFLPLCSLKHLFGKNFRVEYLSHPELDWGVIHVFGFVSTSSLTWHHFHCKMMTSNFWHFEILLYQREREGDRESVQELMSDTLSRVNGLGLRRITMEEIEPLDLKESRRLVVLVLLVYSLVNKVIN